MRVTFNAAVRAGTESVAKAAADLAARQREVASGRRIQVPSDSPSGAAAAVVERAELAVTEQYRQAADTVTSRLSVLDTVLSSLIDATTSAKVAVQAGRGSSTEAQRQSSADQLEGLRDSILVTVNSQFRGTYLFSGTDAATPPYTRTGGTISAYQGAAEDLEVDVDRHTAVRVSMNADAVLRGDDPVDLFAVLQSLADAVRSGDAAALDAGVEALDRAFARLNRALRRVGDDMNLVEARREQLDMRQLASKARLSSIEDTNMAEAISAMTQAETAYRAALGAVSTTSKLTLLDFLR